MADVPAGPGGQVRRVYADATTKILGQVRARTVKGTSAAARRRLRSDVARTVAQAHKDAAVLLAAEVEAAERAGRLWAAARLTERGLPLPPVSARLPLSRPLSLLSGSTRGVVGFADRALLLAGQGGGQRALNRFADWGVAGRDSAGKAHELEAYAGMVAGNAVRDARLVAAVDPWLRAGLPALVQVPQVGGACPRCSQWEGMVLSLDGDHPGYPTLDAARNSGLLHPRCRHEPYPVEGPMEPVRAVTRERLPDEAVDAARLARRWGRRYAVALTPEAERSALTRLREWVGRARGVPPVG